jgi:DNA-binding SARP family transcriptional activator/tetratricopeptide (TPR) repeat protein
MDFNILGPIEAIEANRPLALGGSKQRALLGMLLLHANEVVSSDRLIDELWAGEGREEAVRALQVAVSRLRKALEPDRATGANSRVVVTRAPGYELRVDPQRLDAKRFEALVSEGRQALAGGDPRSAREKLNAALGLWRGPPLADLAYESFCQAEISRLEELRVSALLERVAADLELGRHAEVVGELRTLVPREPLRERLRGQLMVALYRSGRQAEALEVYRDTRRLLVDELGIEPSRELKELERAILAQDPVLDVRERERAEPPSAPRHASDGFVGRESEMGGLVSLLDGAFSGSGALVLIGGEPGVGKSRLAEALAAHAHERGGRVLVGRCWEAGGAPAYWPWVQALRAYVRESDPEVLRSQVGRGSAELTAILPELRELVPDLPASPASGSEGARFRLFEALASFLRSAATAEPLALFLDDLHAADAPSLLLLRFVAGQLAGAPILIVGCYRDSEIAPDLAEALPELTREPSVRRVSLTGLSISDTARLLELTTGRAPPDELAARVHAQTEGNPLFAGEVARLLASEGPLAQAEASDARLPIPEGVREAIGRRLQRRSDRCRQVLTLASVLGREFDLDALGRVSGLAQAHLFAALEEAVAARVVGEVPGGRGRLRFSHVLIRDTLYEALPATRRLRLHRDIGEALEALYAENLEPHLAELAHHFLEAGSAETEKAIRHAGRAGDRAAAQLGYEEAARHYTSALRLLETAGAADAEASCEVLLPLGDVLSRVGNGSEAKEAFRRAAAIAEASGRSDLLARAALGYGGRFAWARAGSDAALVPLLERGLAAVGEEDSPARVGLLARLSYAVRDEPSRDRRIRFAGEAVETARRIGDPVTLAHALEGWAMARGPDNVDGRIATADELISLADAIGDPEHAYMGHEFRLHTFWTLGDRAGTDVEFDSLRRLAEDLRQAPQRWHLSSLRTMLALMEGRFERAEELISETLSLGQRAESWNAVVSQRLALFVLCREHGRLAELEDTIGRSVHEYPALPRFRCALAHLHGELGHEGEARAAFDDLMSRNLGREHLDEEWLFGMSLLPDVCAFLGDAGAAAQLYALLLPYQRLYAEAPIEATFGSIARGLGVLATTLGRFDDAERHFDAALETERRMRARPWLAHTQHDLAAMLIARGGPGAEERARGLVVEALTTYRDLGMESWAARATALAC